MKVTKENRKALFMGMAAGQARLLSITARMSDNELRAQIINNNKMRLATESSQVSEAYIQALNDAQLMFSNYDANNNATYQQLTFNTLTAYNPYNNQYALSNASGNVLISELDARNYEAANSLEAFLRCYGLEYTTDYFNETLATACLANCNADGEYLDSDGKPLNPNSEKVPVYLPLYNENGTLELGKGNNEHYYGLKWNTGLTVEQLRTMYEGSENTLPVNKDVKLTCPGYMSILESQGYYDYQDKLNDYFIKKEDYDAYVVVAKEAKLDIIVKNAFANESNKLKGLDSIASLIDYVKSVETTVEGEPKPLDRNFTDFTTIINSLAANGEIGKAYLNLINTESEKAQEDPTWKYVQEKIAAMGGANLTSTIFEQNSFKYAKDANNNWYILTSNGSDGWQVDAKLTKCTDEKGNLTGYNLGYMEEVNEYTINPNNSISIQSIDTTKLVQAGEEDIKFCIGGTDTTLTLYKSSGDILDENNATIFNQNDYRYAQSSSGDWYILGATDDGSWVPKKKLVNGNALQDIEQGIKYISDDEANDPCVELTLPGDDADDKKEGTVSLKIEDSDVELTLYNPGETSVTSVKPNNLQNQQTMLLEVLRKLQSSIYDVWNYENFTGEQNSNAIEGTEEWINNQLYEKYEAYEAAAIKLGKFIYGDKTYDITKNDNGEDILVNAPLPIDKLGDFLANAYYKDGDNDLKLKDDDNKAIKEKTAEGFDWSTISDNFKQVLQVLILDEVMSTYGEPKYAYIDQSNPNENGDAKAQWYTNLFNRIEQGGYKTIKDGLASSPEWIKFAFESGIVTLEQVDDKYTWNKMIYTNSADITEQTDSVAVAKAEAEYNAAMNKIENKDKRYDMELKNIDTEHNSLQTEYESIKTAVDKNIERTFKLYS